MSKGSMSSIVVLKGAPLSWCAIFMRDLVMELTPKIQKSVFTMVQRKGNYLKKVFRNYLDMPNALNGFYDLPINRAPTAFSKWSSIADGAEFSQFRVITARVLFHPRYRAEGAYGGEYILSQRSTGEADPGNATWTEAVEESLSTPSILRRIDEKGTLTLKLTDEAKRWRDINDHEGSDLYQCLVDVYTKGFAASETGSLIEEIVVALR